MIKTIVNKYLAKHQLKTVNEKEYENMIKYRATRGEMRRVIDDYNEMVELLAQSATLGVLRDKLEDKKIDTNGMSRKELQKAFIDNYSKEFRKS